MIKFGAFFLLLIGFSANVRAQRWNDLHKEAIDLYNKKEFTAAIPLAERAIEAARQEFRGRAWELSTIPQSFSLTSISILPNPVKS